MVTALQGGDGVGRALSVCDREEVGQEAVRGEGPGFDLGKGGLKYGSSGTVISRRLDTEGASEGRPSSRGNMGRRGSQEESLRATLSKAPWMGTGELRGLACARKGVDGS